MISNIENLLARDKDYFLLISDADEGKERIIPVSHISDDPLTDGEIMLVDSKLAHFPLMRDFYKLYGSTELFSVDDIFESGIVIDRPDQWDILSAEVEEWLSSYDDDDFPEWVSTAIVIGFINGSTDYFLLVTDGEMAGHIYGITLEGLELENIATDFAEFLSILSGSDSVLAGYLRVQLSGYNNSGWLVSAYCTDTFNLSLSHA